MKYLEVKTKDIEYNLNKIRKYLEDNKPGKQSPNIIAVVKCNMYGFGMEKFAKTLADNGIENFAVAETDEALDLRTSGIDSNILLLSPTQNKEELTKLIQNEIIVTVQSIEDIEIVDEISRQLKKNVRVNVKIDTGFSRYGILWNDEQTILDVFKHLNSSKNLMITSTFSHFAESFSNSKFTKQQYNRFMEVVQMLKDNDLQYGFLHIANSNAIFKSNTYFLDAVRIGSALLGRVIVKNKLGLKKIGKLKTQICEIKEIPPKSYVGYSRTYKTNRQMKIGILPIGTCDGIFLTQQNDCFRFLDKLRLFKKNILTIFSNGNLYVKIDGKEYKVVGKVGTKFVIIDITNTDFKIRQEVEINCSYNYLSQLIKRRYI